MKNTFRNFLYFSREERRGILLLCVLIVASLCVIPVYRQHRLSIGRPEAEDTTRQAALRQEYAAFTDSLRSHRKPWKPRNNTHKQTSAYTPPTLTPFPFDPNTADSALLSQLGLPGWMARNVVRYREKGGRFRQVEDFRKIYGLTDEQYQTLLPYIQITPQPDTIRQPPRVWLAQTESDSTARPFKYPAGTVIELNSADTTELKKIPGIGSGIARLIVGYRERLGGFHHIGQLQEINLNSELLGAWFRIDTTTIRRLNLNRAGIERLRDHPYLNFYQARAIVEWRRKNGRLRNLKPFLLYEEFTKEDFRRLAPYVCFE